MTDLLDEPDLNHRLSSLELAWIESRLIRLLQAKQTLEMALGPMFAAGLPGGELAKVREILSEIYGRIDQLETDLQKASETVFYWKAKQ